MKKVIRAELYYLLKSNKLWIYIGIFAACTAVNLFVMKTNPGLDAALFVITTLLVSELMHKDGDKTTLKNIAGSGVTYGEIFYAKCVVVIIVCGAMLVVTTLASAAYDLLQNPDAFDVTAVLMDFLIKFANYLIILIIGEFTGSAGGTIIISILVTVVLPMIIGLIGAWDNGLAKICNAIYPYTLDGLKKDPLNTAMLKYLGNIVVIAILLFCNEKHYKWKHYN